MLMFTTLNTKSVLEMRRPAAIVLKVNLFPSLLDAGFQRLNSLLCHILHKIFSVAHCAGLISALCC